MGFRMYESYYMQIKELNFLLAGLDIPCIYGIASDKVAIPDREEINRILIGLYQKEIIDLEGDSIVIKQPYTDIFETILRSKKCAVVRGYREESLVWCCYLTEEAVVITEKSQREEEALRISCMPYAEWIRMLEEYLDMENKYIDSKDKLLLEIRDSKTGISYASIRLFEHGLQTILVETIDEKEEQILYEKEILVQRVIKWLGEAEG